MSERNPNHLLHICWSSMALRIQKVESCIMNEWVSNGNWEPWHLTPGFSQGGQGGGRVQSHILLHPGVSRKESCKLNISSPFSYPTERCRGKKSSIWNKPRHIKIKTSKNEILIRYLRNLIRQSRTTFSLLFLMWCLCLSKGQVSIFGYKACIITTGERA